MNNVLVLGAGRSAHFLIRTLLGYASETGRTVTVAERDVEAAAKEIAGHPRGKAVAVEARNRLALRALVREADIVINLLPPTFQPAVARACLDAGRSMISASYQDQRIRDLDAEAKNRGVALLTELGLDPGIDLMAAAELIHRVEEKGGVVEVFESYGSGVPAPESIDNPLRYAVTWNPRNVVMAAEHGAQYLAGGKVRIVPWHRIFAETWPVEVDGVGTMEAYPNRDSFSYRDSLDLPEVQTLIRGTLRHPGFAEIWLQLVRLGLPTETFRIQRLAGRTWRDLTEAFLPPGGNGTLRARVARLLGLNATGQIIESLAWLGLFSDEPIGDGAETPAEALTRLISRRLVLPPGGRDMIILLNRLEVRYPAQANRREEIVATLVEKGEPGGPTAMARTVGLPAAVAARLITSGALELTGAPLPTDPRLYRPLLRELAGSGIGFRERTRPLSEAP